MNKNKEKPDNIEIKNESIVNSRFVVLYKGTMVSKKVFHPMLAEVMGIRSQTSGYIKVKVQPFCGIDLLKNPHIFVAGVFFIHPVSGKVRSDITLYVVGAEKDLVISYRIWRILENLSEINIIGNMRLVTLIASDWKRFTRSAKKKSARDIGISLQKLEQIMEMFPPDLERVNSISEKQGINISMEPFQEAVLAGKTALTPLLKNLGVKSAEEIAKEEREIGRVIKPYLKYLKFYYGEQFEQDCPFAQMFAGYAIETINALKSGNIVPEKDIILGIGLIRLENKVFDESLQSSINIFPEDIIKEIALNIKGIDARNKKDVIENVTNFLVNEFPESGLNVEDYKRKILDAMDIIEMSKPAR